MKKCRNRKATKKICNLGGDAEHCEECAYYSDYEYNIKTAQCERRIK